MSGLGVKIAIGLIGSALVQQQMNEAKTNAELREKIEKQQIVMYNLEATAKYLTLYGESFYKDVCMLPVNEVENNLPKYVRRNNVMNFLDWLL